MDIQELINRERITIRENRQALIQVIETQAAAHLSRLDDIELRIQKEALTNGSATIKAPAVDDAPVDIGIIAPNRAEAGAK
jgi:hypothetical protein